jgi:hypothetical protein
MAGVTPLGVEVVHRELLLGSQNWMSQGLCTRRLRGEVALLTGPAAAAEYEEEAPHGPSIVGKAFPSRQGFARGVSGRETAFRMLTECPRFARLDR